MCKFPPTNLVQHDSTLEAAASGPGHGPDSNSLKLERASTSVTEVNRGPGRNQTSLPPAAPVVLSAGMRAARPGPAGPGPSTVTRIRVRCQLHSRACQCGPSAAASESCLQARGGNGTAAAEASSSACGLAPGRAAAGPRQWWPRRVGPAWRAFRMIQVH